MELDEAAAIEGCGYLRYVIRIVIPLASPAIATVAVLHAIGVWNELVLATIYLTTADYYPITRGLIVFNGVYGNDWPLLAAAVLMIASPMMIVLRDHAAVHHRRRDGRSGEGLDGDARPPPAGAGGGGDASRTWRGSPASRGRRRHGSSTTAPRSARRRGRRSRPPSTKLGYVPNRAARSLMTRRSDSIGVVIMEPAGSLFVDPFFGSLLVGHQRRAAPRVTSSSCC